MTPIKFALMLLCVIVHTFPMLFGECKQYDDLIANLECHNRSIRSLYSPRNIEEALEVIRIARRQSASVSVKGGGIEFLLCWHRKTYESIVCFADMSCRII